SFQQIRHLRGLCAFVEELIKRDLESTRQLFQRLNSRNGVPILDARNVAAKQAGALFDVALRELLFLTKFAEAFADNHGRILSLRLNSRNGNWLVESCCLPSRINLVRSHKHRSFSIMPASRITCVASDLSLILVSSQSASRLRPRVTQNFG